MAGHKTASVYRRYWIVHRYWTSRDRAANLRLFRLVSEVLRAIEAGVFHPVVGWHCGDCPYKSRCWAWG